MSYVRDEFDTDEVEPALRIVALTERHRRSLGMPMLGMLAARAGARYIPNVGRGNIGVGPKTWGKGVIVEGSDQSIFGTIFEDTTFVSPSWVAQRIVHGIKTDRPIKHLQVSFEDLANLTLNTYWLEQTMATCSNLISNLKFSYKPRGKDAVTDGSTDRAWRFESFSFTGGSTTKLLHRITRRQEWANMWSDRFIKLALLKTWQDERLIREYEVSGRGISSEDLNRRIGKLISPLPDSVEICVPGKDLEAGATELFGGQVERRRRIQYFKGDLCGIAAICGSDRATSDHLALLRALRPYYEVGSLPAGSILWVQRAHYEGTIKLGKLMHLTGYRNPWGALERTNKLERRELLSVETNTMHPRRSIVRVGPALQADMGNLRNLVKVALTSF